MDSCSLLSNIVGMTQKIMRGESLTRADADYLVNKTGPEDLPDLFAAASRIRLHFRGGGVSACSIVAAKVGRCPEDCAFCSQSAHYNTHINHAALSVDAICRAADEAVKNGAQSFGIVNSGLGPTEEEIELCGQVAARIRRSSDNHVRLCGSLGVLTKEQAYRLAEIGIQRYNHNLQTSRRYFPRIVTTHNYDDRLQTLYLLKEAGISLCTGALFGMGETWADRLDLAFLLKELNPDVIPINFLIPIKGTPLESQQLLDPMECLKMIAIYRFILPRQEIKIAGGREANLRDLQSWIFLAGADSIMVGNYLTTCGRDPQVDRQMLVDLKMLLNPND